MYSTVVITLSNEFEQALCLWHTVADVAPQVPSAFPCGCYDVSISKRLICDYLNP